LVAYLFATAYWRDALSIDASKSALIFEDMIASIKKQNPERALGWIIEKYEILVKTCE